MAQANPSEIPHYIAARSKQGLRRLMLKTNLKLRMTIQYFDIQYDVQDKKWIAWFYARPDQDDKLFNEVSDGTET